MGAGTKPLDRQTVLYFVSTLAANQTMFAKQGAAAAPIIPLHGQKRLVGNISTDQAPAAGFPRISFSPDGLTFPLVYVLTVDPSQTNNQYTFDIEIALPYCKIELTNGNGGVATVSAEATAYPEGSGASNTGGGGTTIYVKDAPLTDLGFGQITTLDATAAKTLAQIFGSAIPTGTTAILIQVGTGVAGDTSVPCLWRADGSAPTATVGQTLLLGVGLTLPLVPASLANFKIIGSAAGPSTVRVTFFQ